MTENPAGPLARYTVLDPTRARSGPTAVRQLADWGAKVIKIEEIGDEDGDGSPFDKRHGPDFQNLHRNKRSITLNLKSRDGVQVFKRMATTADVIVENYRPDVKRRLMILNMIAYLIAITTAIYSIQQSFLDYEMYKPIIWSG